MSSVVSIHTLQGKVVGSGVIVADDLILTCAHVVNAALGRQREKENPPGAEEAEDKGGPRKEEASSRARSLRRLRIWTLSFVRRLTVQDSRISPKKPFSAEDKVEIRVCRFPRRHPCRKTRSGP